MLKSSKGKENIKLSENFQSYSKNANNDDEDQLNERRHKSKHKKHKDDSDQLSQQSKDDDERPKEKKRKSKSVKQKDDNDQLSQQSKDDDERPKEKKRKSKSIKQKDDGDPLSKQKSSKKKKQKKKDNVDGERSSKKHKKKHKDDDSNKSESKSRKKSSKISKIRKKSDSDDDNENLDEFVDETRRGKELIEKAVASGELKLIDFKNLKGEELQRELEREKNEREKRMQKYITLDHKAIMETDNSEQLDDQVLTLENELAILKENINNFAESPKEGATISESKAILTRKKEWLAFQSLELEHLFDSTGYKFEMLEKKHKAMNEALKNIESVKTDMRKIVKYRTILSKLQTGLEEADAVITEMQNMAYNLLPKNVSKHCKDVEATRKRLIDMQDDLMEKKHFAKKELVITQKEIIAINQALVGEVEATKLLEARKEQELQRLVHLHAKNNEIDDIIENCNSKLDLLNLTLEEAQEAKMLKEQSANKNELEVKLNIKEEKLKEIKEMNKLLKDQIAKVNEKIENIEKEISQNHIAANQSVEINDELEKINKATAERRLLAEKLQTERVLRKTYYNQIEDMKGAIRVYCRVRPISRTEKERNDPLCIEFPDIYTILIKQPDKKNVAERSKEYLFDRVFPLDSTQKEIFADIDRLIEIVFAGFNVCIFAYGQTGSGKTFTLIGDMDSKEKMGVVPRAFIRFFEIIDVNKQTTDTETSFYMIELYNDKLLDLMKSDAEYVENLKIVKNEHGMVIVPGVTMLNARTTNDMFKYFHQANKNRHIAATKMNSESSRSHLILTIMFTFTNKISSKRFFGKMSMIDLAGSERLAKSGATGINQTEAASINKALTALGDVISALTTMNKGFVPYRNNKLTQLMQDSLGGTAKTLLIVNLSPVEYNVTESISSLNYAARMKTIVNENLKVADEDEVQKLKEILNKLLRGDPVIID